MALVENSDVTKKAPSYTHVEEHQFRPTLSDSNPEVKLMDLINNKGWDGHTVYDRKKGIFTTALYLAVEAENTSVISWLLKWSPNKVKDILEADSSNGRTALHAAVATKDPDVVPTLLLKLKDPKQVNVDDKEGNTPLHIAVKKKNVEVIARLLRAGADPCKKNNKGDAPLHLAVKGGNLEVLKELLRDVDTPDSGKGHTPLHLALSRDWGNQLIANGADPCRKKSPLHLAALQVKVNESEVFQLLLHTALKARLEKAECVEDITNALEEVRKQEDGAFTKALEALKYGWNIHNVYANKTALHLTSEIGNEGLVKALLNLNEETKLDVVKQDELGNTALHFAASGGYFGIVKLLLDASADVKQQNKKGDSPLHFAVGPQGKDEIVTELLKAGAETNKRNELGQTPLHFAVAQKRDYIARKLAYKGADFHLKDNTGAGVLHFAARGGGRDIFELLKDKLKEDLNVNQATKAGLTPLHFAAWNGNRQALHWLLEFNCIKLDARDSVENGLPWQWAAMGGEEECLRRLINQHVQKRIQVFPGSHMEWKRVFQRIEDHNQASIIDLVPRTFSEASQEESDESEELEEESKESEEESEESEELEEESKESEELEEESKESEELEEESKESEEESEVSKESQVEKDSLVLEPGILSSAAAYGDMITNKRLVRVLKNQLKVVKESRVMEWAALSSTRGTEFGGKDRFEAVKVVMEFLMKKCPHAEEINNQLRLAFKIALSNNAQSEYEAHGRDTFAKCMAECYTWELPNMIKEAIWKELDIKFQNKYQKLPRLYKDAFNDESELAEDVPVAYWEAKLEEDRSFKGLKGARYTYKATMKKRDELTQRVKQCSKFIKDYPNDRSRRTGRTALHWATIFGERETVIALSAKGCKPDICDTFGKPPHWYAQWVHEVDTVMINCLEWSGYIDNLHKERQMIVDGLNGILVGSALIASVTFGGFLSPPLEYKLKFKDREYVSMDITGVVVFWVANSLAFFFAMASALVGVIGVLPPHVKFNLRLLHRLHSRLVHAAVMLVLSISCVLVAFGAAGFSALPPLQKYQRNMISTSVPGALACIGPLCTFIYTVYNWTKFESWSPNLEGGEMRFGSQTLEELLSPKLRSPFPPQRYTRNGQLPWEDGLDSLVGETVRDQDESLHTSRVQRRVQDERVGASEARTDQEDERRSGQTVITVTQS